MYWFNDGKWMTGSDVETVCHIRQLKTLSIKCSIKHMENRTRVVKIKCLAISLVFPHIHVHVHVQISVVVVNYNYNYN